MEHFLECEMKRKSKSNSNGKEYKTESFPVSAHTESTVLSLRGFLLLILCRILQQRLHIRMSVKKALYLPKEHLYNHIT